MQQSQKQNKNTTIPSNKSDLNLTERITKLQDLTNDNNTYKILLGFIPDIE